MLEAMKWGDGCSTVVLERPCKCCIAAKNFTECICSVVLQGPLGLGCHWVPLCLNLTAACLLVCEKFSCGCCNVLS
ncbi:hypothetical protein K7X08_011284 [Anisodus acutangulus]|uniref:Uncharacterized protein n=1 Tax=Anisodus acutangulus TaxID=402998 RepID=A0A9Q1R8L3_9SOLA|nr:hypothetical protein K7X08_011284 [Anisodus acutangulus]